VKILKRIFSIESIKHLVYLPKIIAKIKNWVEFTKAYVTLSKNFPSKVVFRDGTEIEITNPADLSTIAVINIKEDYGRIKENSIVVDLGANIGVFTNSPFAFSLNLRSRFIKFFILVYKTGAKKLEVERQTDSSR